MISLYNKHPLQLSRSFSVAFALFSFVAAPSLRAEIVTVEVVASISSLVGTGDYEARAELVRLGDGLITGTYTYDTDVTDSNGLPEIGDYRHTSAGYGLDLSSGGLRFRTNPANVDFLVTAVDNSAGSDNLVMFSYNNDFAGSNDPGFIGLQLSDSSMTALSNTQLPNDAPNIAQWDDNFLVIVSSNSWGVLVIEADIVSFKKLSTSTPPKSTVQLLSDLTATILNLNDDQGIRNFDHFTGSLEAKLDAAVAALEDMKKGDKQSAKGKIQAFINEVSAQKGTKLTDSQADELIAAAAAILVSLG